MLFNLPELNDNTSRELLYFILKIKNAAEGRNRTGSELIFEDRRETKSNIQDK